MPILPGGHKLHVRLPSGCRYFAVKIKCYGLFLFVQLILTDSNHHVIVGCGQTKEETASKHNA